MSKRRSCSLVLWKTTLWSKSKKHYHYQSPSPAYTTETIKSLEVGPTSAGSPSSSWCPPPGWFSWEIHGDGAACSLLDLNIVFHGTVLRLLHLPTRTLLLPLPSSDQKPGHHSNHFTMEYSLSLLVLDRFTSYHGHCVVHGPNFVQMYA